MNSLIDYRFDSAVDLFRPASTSETNVLWDIDRYYILLQNHENLNSIENEDFKLSANLLIKFRKIYHDRPF